MNDITILSTACGAIFMPGFFKCLKSNGERAIRIVGCDISDDPIMELIVDKYYCVPRYTDESYIDRVIEICLLEKVNIVFPHMSMELLVFQRRLSDFHKLGIKVAISDTGLLSVANNKYKLYEAMRNHGIKTPKYFLVDSSDTLRNKASTLGYPEKPICIKVTQSSGGRGVRIVKANLSRGEAFLNEKPSSMNTTLDEMCGIIDECQRLSKIGLQEIIAMEYLPGYEYTVDLLADHGKTIYIVGRLNTVSSISIAMESIVEERPKAYELCKKIVDMLKLDGNIGFDFMLDERGEPILTDLNPRVTATIVLYLGAGLNLPYLRIKQLLDEELPYCTIEYGTRLVRKYNDVCVHANGRIIN